MRYLKLGSQGDDVYLWELFLRGINPASKLIVDDYYGNDTVNETKIFQKSVGLTGNDIDGIVGNITLAKAVALGFKIAEDEDNEDELSQNWPIKQNNIKQLSYLEREKIFGNFSFIPDPRPGNPELIKITDGWQKNVVDVEIPQLKNVIGVSSSLKVSFHQKAAKQLQKVFSDWENAGLSNKILTWSGSWAPRFIRGSRTVLSNHAWALAFDINSQWNALGSVPALKDQKGSVRELVKIANQNGFFWGGHFNGRPDGMHFEIFKLIE